MIAAAGRPGGLRLKWNRLRTYLSKPQNTILLLLGIILTITTIAPMITIVADTVTIHQGSVDARARPESAPSDPGCGWPG